jgi:uncharacterized protein (DUF1800 family)
MAHRLRLAVGMSGTFTRQACRATVAFLVTVCLHGTLFAQAQDPLTPRRASRFLAQATLGADWEEIERATQLGIENWLADQFQQPIGRHEPLLQAIENSGVILDSAMRRGIWWQQVMESPDLLRQRVALALSEIYVISDNHSAVDDNVLGASHYYDMLLEHSFGNFRDLLLDVSLHPVMGAYLSHLGNERSNPAQGRFPDENYAREVMQLFSVGLFELNIDGTLQRDGAGNAIPTYDNDDITEFAKIFTGLSYASAFPDFRSGVPVWDRPMRMYDPYHEPGPKFLLRGRYVPATQSGMQDIESAIDNLFEHPNVGPFLGRRLIQRMVTSNPSPAYVRHVAEAFGNNGNGVRGDMRAVIRAVLLDPEARTWPTTAISIEGRVRESFLRRVHLARAFNASNLMRDYPIADGRAPVDFGQRPLSSPTVFNFFLPDHQPTGEIANRGLFAPEFQIITAVTAIASADSLESQITTAMNSAQNPLAAVRLDLTDEVAMAPNVTALIDRLDLLMTYGNMSGQMRQILIENISRLSDPVERAQMALYLIAISPEYAVIQ